MSPKSWKQTNHIKYELILDNDNDNNDGVGSDGVDGGGGLYHQKI